MSMDIEQAGHQPLAGGVDDLRSFTFQLRRTGFDLAPAYTDIALLRRGTATVKYQRILDQSIPAGSTFSHGVKPVAREIRFQHRGCPNATGASTIAAQSG
jgi:hypothetical protein